MFRWFRRVTLTISAVICFFLVAVTVRSYFVGDNIRKYLDPLFPNQRMYVTIDSSWVGIGITHVALDPNVVVSNNDSEYWISEDYISLFVGDESLAEVGFPVILFNMDVQLGGFYFGCDEYTLSSQAMVGGARAQPLTTPLSGYTTVLIVNLYWLIALTGLPLLLALLMWWHKRHRIRVGICHKCGYNLRASNDTCPECGAAIPETPITQPA